jgi:class 3 adenylate cyclase
LLDLRTQGLRSSRGSPWLSAAPLFARLRLVSSLSIAKLRPALSVAGIAQGYATLGQIGFSERSGYTAIGTVCNVAARLCAEAKDGQILLSQRVNLALRGSVVTEQVGALALKGLTQPVVAYNVPLVGSQAAFRVIEGGAPSA